MNDLNNDDEARRLVETWTSRYKSIVQVTCSKTKIIVKQSSGNREIEKLRYVIYLIEKTYVAKVDAQPMTAPGKEWISFT